MPAVAELVCKFEAWGSAALRRSRRSQRLMHLAPVPGASSMHWSPKV